MFKKRTTTSPSVHSQQNNPSTPIPTFFVIRTAAWFALSLLASITSVALGIISKKWDASFILGMILAALLLHKGLELLHIARKDRYFVLELECVEIAERSLKDARNIWDPTSQTALRKTATVSFADASGARLQFIFDAGRHFVIGSAYSFYFCRPQNDNTPITAEMLERLKIDHEVKSLPVSNIVISKPIQTSSATEKQQI